MHLHMRHAVVVTILLTLCAASTARAQVVTFSSVRDAVSGRFFNSSTTARSPLNANALRIGFDTGFDAALLKYRDFRASTATYYNTTVMDTISFNVTAPSGFYISKITYVQKGSGSVLRTGKATGATTWVVAGRPANGGTFSTSPAMSRTVDLASRKLTSVPVSITTSLFAYATPSGGSATVSLTGAEVVVQLAPK